MKKIALKIYIFLAVIALVACGNQSEPYTQPEDYALAERTEYPAENSTAEHDPQEYHPQDSPMIFTTTVRIHEDMPAFTIYRTIGDYTLSWRESRVYDFPSPREVSLRIEDEDGNLIQLLSGLTQSNQWNSIERIEPVFDDYNFDGYLDMRLHRWQPGAGGLMATEYFWLWDTEKSQFVLNEQLVEIGHAASTIANQETRRIEVWHRLGGGEGLAEFYEYHGGEFVLVVYERHYSWLDSQSDRRYTEITHTNVLTGEVTVTNEVW